MMFWKKKDKAKSASEAKPNREEILAQAKANMANARAEIGDETLDKIREALIRKQQSAIEQAKNQIRNADQDKVRDHLRYMIREEK